MDAVWEKYLDDAVAQGIFDIFKREAHDGLLVSSAHPARQALSSVRSLPPHVRFVYLLFLPARVAQRMATAINMLPSAAAHCTPSWSQNGSLDVHATHREGTKEYAIRAWQTMEHVLPEETIGMGDSGNDEPIFRSAGLRVAVQNSTAEIYAQADYIAPSAADGALRHVVKKFFIDAATSSTASRL